MSASVRFCNNQSYITTNFHKFGFAAPHQLAFNQDTYREMALQRNEFEVKYMVLLSVTIRDYVINIVTTHECAHQDAHFQVAAVMMRSKTGSRY